MHAGALAIAEQACRLLEPPAAIPDDPEGALEVPMALPDKAKDILARAMPRGEGKREAHALAHGRDGDRAGDGEAVVTVPTPSRLLRAPLAAAQLAPDTRGTLRNTKRAVQDHSKAPQGPEVMAQAMHTWAVAEESA